MLKCLEKGDLSVLILPPIIKLLKQDDFIEKEQFLTNVWPPLRQLCQAGEIPAQGLYLLVDNSKIFAKFISADEFQTVYLPLILKALEWGVHKLQFLGLKKIPFLSKNIEYMTFKTQVMPRLIMILTDANMPLNLKEKGCEILIEILSILDRNYLRDTVLKALQWLRENINEPLICMHLLTLYNNIASALTPEDIGNKILPGLIPMLISASFTKKQFTQLITTIRTLIDQLEKHRLKDLSEIDPMEATGVRQADNENDIFAGLGGNFDNPGSTSPSNDFDFLKEIEGKLPRWIHYLDNFYKSFYFLLEYT